MSYGSTPWGYIHQRKKTEEVATRATQLREENQRLKAIIKKLRDKEELTEYDRKFIEKLGVS